jgi:SagB-type dehydrogenase family enzyme
MDDKALTIRLHSGMAVVSDDYGISHKVTGPVVEEIQRLAIAGGSQLPAGALPAAALGTLGESARIQPRAELEPSTTETTEHGEAVDLGSHLLPSSRPLADVLNARVSERDFAHSVELTELATVLMRAGRVTGWRGPLEQTRALPSAGGRTPIELDIVTTGVPGVPTGRWRFDPFHCRLLRRSKRVAESVPQLLKERGISTGDSWVVIFAVADFTRTLRRYPGGSSLVWRDAGVALGGLHLCATEIGVASCIIGSCGVLQSVNDTTVDVGALIVGHR